MEEKKILEIIEKIKPFLQSEGGNIEFIKYENNIVYINLGGACACCPMVDITLKEVIETAIKEEIPSVKEVINLNS